MQVSGRFVRLGGGVLAGSVVLLASIYVTALAVNRNDRPPSDDARALAASLDSLPDVPGEENAYVYLLGFAAPRDADPRQIGAERAEWIRRLRTDYLLGRDTDPYPADLSAVWRPEPHGFFRKCPSAREEQDCFAILNAAGDDIDDWLAEQRWILARYETLLGHDYWREIETGDHRGPLAGFSSATDARNAWLIDAWARASRGDADGVREALHADLAFWRLALAQSGTLIAKLISADMVATHFERSNVILKRLPAERIEQALPPAWREPISAQERSMREAFAFELEVIRSFLVNAQSSTNRYAAWAGVSPEPPTLMQRFREGITTSLLQPQDLVNKVAAKLIVIADAAEAPFPQFSGALDAARELQIEAAYAAHWAESLYNVTGDLLRRADDHSVYVDAAARMADLEGVRRAAVLTAELRSRGVEPNEVEAAIRDTEAKSPYTQEPFAWDAASGAIVFQGLRRRDGGRYAFWY